MAYSWVSNGCCFSCDIRKKRTTLICDLSIREAAPACRPEWLPTQCKKWQWKPIRTCPGGFCSQRLSLQKCYPGNPCYMLVNQQRFSIQYLNITNHHASLTNPLASWSAGFSIKMAQGHHFQRHDEPACNSCLESIHVGDCSSH